MTCSNSAANALGESRQRNTGDTFAADLEQIIIRLGNKIVNKVTEIMTCSKSTVHASESCKTKQHQWCILMILDISSCSRNIQCVINTSLLKVICRDVCLCKLTYPVIYRLTLSNSDLPQRSKILNIIQKQLHSISTIRITIYEMTLSLPAVLTCNRSVQLKQNSNVNWTVKLSQKQIRASAKQNSIR